MGSVVADNVPLEGLTEESDIDAREAEIHIRQARKKLRQELKHQVLEHCDQVADDDKKTALADPLSRAGMFFRKTIPKSHIILQLF